MRPVDALKGDRARIRYRVYVLLPKTRGLQLRTLIAGTEAGTGRRHGVSTTTAAATHEATGTGVSGLQCVKGRNHWIVLDAAWAQRVGVRREAGVYRIRSRELTLKLGLLGQLQASGAPTATEAVLAPWWPAGPGRADHGGVRLAVATGPTGCRPVPGHAAA